MEMRLRNVRVLSEDVERWGRKDHKHRHAAISDCRGDPQFHVEEASS